MARFPDLDQRIRDDIAAGVIALGARITIDELAGRYGVSHMPVREALRQLHGSGLVTMEPGRGARVISIDERFVETLFDTRGAIETLLASSAARHIDATALRALRAIEEEREASVAARQYAAALEGNRRFHQAVNVAANNPHGIAIVEQHWVLLFALWRAHGYAEQRFSGVSSDHLNLIRALEAHDSEAAGTIMAAHVIKAKYNLLAAMRTKPADRQGDGAAAL
jgi:DNA-binding GntR family transcriptional regulator